jgi:hypothetical protein
MQLIEHATNAWNNRDREAYTASYAEDCEIVFAVFAAGSEAVVAQACRRAGLPADRLTPAACTTVE